MIENFWPVVSDNSSVPLSSIHSAFRDGFALCLRSMESRSTQVLQTALELEEIFPSPISAALHFIPQGWDGQYPELAVAHYTAEDRLVQAATQRHKPTIRRPAYH